ncbi:transposase [Mucilaginibacter arboris]|uniref:Transposase n=1 Tax=Mucilaginibacter arboris TaxID=2682090 RepID=A0A7K1STY0_9SPHI|nr:transposase [Mucilaginibacter arboris]MVN20718.1 transposase [Mucilaginibacter arboris]
MSTIRKQYDREFKVMAVELNKGHSDLGVLAKELEIRSALLYRWRRELETKAETSFPGQGKVIYIPEQAEIRRLKKELLDMQQERDILKRL